MQTQKNRKKAKIRDAKLQQITRNEKENVRDDQQKIFQGEFQVQAKVQIKNVDSEVQSDQDDVPFTQLFSNNQVIQPKGGKKVPQKLDNAIRQRQKRNKQVDKGVKKDKGNKVQTYGQIKEVQDQDFLPFNKLIEQHQQKQGNQIQSQEIIKVQDIEGKGDIRQHKSFRVMRSTKIQPRNQDLLQFDQQNQQSFTKDNTNKQLEMQPKQRKAKPSLNNKQKYTDVKIVKAQDSSSDSEQPLFTLYKQKGQPVSGIQNQLNKQESKEFNKLYNVDLNSGILADHLVAIPIENAPKQRLRFIQSNKIAEADLISNPKLDKQSNNLQQKRFLPQDSNSQQLVQGSQLSGPKQIRQPQVHEKKVQSPQTHLNTPQQQTQHLFQPLQDKKTDGSLYQQKLGPSPLLQTTNTHAKISQNQLQQLQVRMSAGRTQRRTVYGIQRESRTPEKVQDGKIMQTPTQKDKNIVLQQPSSQQQIQQEQFPSYIPKLDVNFNSQRSSQANTPNQPQKKILKLISSQQKKDHANMHQQDSAQIPNRDNQRGDKTLRSDIQPALENKLQTNHIPMQGQDKPVPIDSKKQSPTAIQNEFSRISNLLGYNSSMQWKYKYSLLIEPQNNTTGNIKTQFEELYKQYGSMQLVHQES